MKVKELINNLQKYDQDMEIILEPHIDCQDSDNYHLAGDILDGNYSELGLRVSEVGSYHPNDDDKATYTCFDFDSSTEEGLFKSKEVVILSSTQFKYGEGNDDRL